MRKRVEKEGLQIRKDFELARECHSKMYEYVDESLIPVMDDWEDVLTNDLYDIEEKIESFLQSLSEPGLAKSVSVSKEQNSEQSGIINSNVDAGGSDVELNNVAPSTSSVVENQSQPKEDSEANELVVNEDSVILESSEPKNTCNSSNPKSNCHNLVEFKETTLPDNMSQMSIAEALYKLEANKDILSIQLIKYDGNPLTYVEFIERFKLLIHDKPHLSDDVRMAQLKMHLIGRAERTMYATALKSIKEHFGQPSAIARAYITKLVDKQKIQNNDRQSLQELSFDVVNCVATLKQSNHLADVNATENLRKIIMRLPNHLTDKWKGVAPDLREKGEIPTLQHIGQFMRKRVKAEFDPDFDDIQKSDNRRPLRDKNGIFSGQRDPKRPLKCYVCSEEHRVVECPTFSSCTIEQRVQHAKDQ